MHSESRHSILTPVKSSLVIQSPEGGCSVAVATEAGSSQSVIPFPKRPSVTMEGQIRS